MKIRELIDKITDERRYGHLMILFFSDLDKDIKDVIREYQSWNPEYVDHLRRIMKEFGINEETSNMTNTVEFTGNGREILELMKKALCEFKNVYVINAFLHPHHGFADTGRATLGILVNIPDEKKWIEITYRHHESPISESGSGSISYKDHYYHREPFPEDHIKRSIKDKFTWGYGMYTGEYILSEILERKKCKWMQNMKAEYV